METIPAINGLQLTCLGQSSLELGEKKKLPRLLWTIEMYQECSTTVGIMNKNDFSESSTSSKHSVWSTGNMNAPHKFYINVVYSNAENLRYS